MSESTPNGSPPPPRPWRRGGMLALRLIVAAAVLAYLFRIVPFAEVVRAIRNSRPELLALAFLSVVGSQLVIAVRLRRLVAWYGVERSAFEMFEINLGTMFYGVFLPAGNFAGIPIRIYRMSRTRDNLAAMTVALLIDRVVASAGLCVVGVFFWLLEIPAEGGPFLLMMLGAVVLLVSALAFVTRGGETGALAALRRRLGALAPRRFESLRRAARQSTTLPGRLQLELIGLAILPQLFGIVGYNLVANALGLELSVITVAWVRSAVMLAAILPVSIAGLGVREGALLLALAPYGVESAEVLAFSFLVFGVTVLGVALLGGLFEARRLLAR